MPATRSYFSAKSDETALGFAVAEFQLLQPLTECLWSCRPLSTQGNSLLAVGSGAEGTCNLMLGETLPPLSTGTAKINTE